MVKVGNTTINIPRELREELKRKKKYKRETYSEVLERLMKKEVQL